MAQRVKKYRRREYFFFGVTLLLAVFLINKYIVSNIKDELIISAKKQIKIVDNLIDNKIGNCENGEVKLSVEGGYVCRDESIPHSFYREIFDKYPISGKGKEIPYEFLDIGDLQVANLMLESVYDLSRYEPIKIEDIGWEEDPYDERYWRFLFYSLRPTRHLMYAWLETGNDAYKDKLIEVLEGYTNKGLAKENIWEDYHAVSFRAMVLVNSWWKLREGKSLTYEMNVKMLDAIKEHGDFLVKSSHHKPGHNHGVNEAMALLTIAVNFPDLEGSDKWRETSVKRLSDSIDNLIDKDGALMENSPYYHFYVLDKYSQIYNYSKSYQVHIKDDFDVIFDKMVNYGKYILKPNLEVPMIGASLYDIKSSKGELSNIAKDSPELHYVLTKGEYGTRPEKRNVFFEDTGQTIMRSGWGEGEEFEKQAHLIYNIGSYRTLHSDYDALSFTLYSGGKNILIDSGLYSYEKSDLNEYFDSTKAHNTIVVDGKDQLPGIVNKGDFIEGDGFVQQSASHNLYPGVTHFRSISLLGKEDVLVVDKIVSKEKHTYSQMFHLDPDLKIILNKGIADVVSGEGEGVVQIRQLNDTAVASEVKKAEGDPVEGWCSYEYEKKVPCESLAFKQEGESVLYITLLHMGEFKDSYLATYNQNLETVNIDNEGGSYSIKIKTPNSLVDPEIKRVKKQVELEKESYTLKSFGEDKGWKVLNERGGIEEKYLVKNEDGRVAINGLDNHRYSIDVQGVDKYYSTYDRVVTDISFEGEEFNVYEQEDFVPILGYHHVLNDGDDIKHPESEMHKEAFSKQIDYLTNVYGCRWYTFEEIMRDYVLLEKKTPRKACVINFDDGRRNNYGNAYPILKENDVTASFYIIPSKLEMSGYMTWEQINEIYYDGNEIGSHTIGGGSLMAFKEDDNELKRQIFDSKKILKDHQYGEVSTFAYPLGEWNESVVEKVKSAGYIAARDTSKDNHWRDRRAQTSSLDEEFIWHMYYYKPELNTPEELVDILGYNTWWQFEEGFEVVSDFDDDIKIRSSIDPTETSYAVLSLADSGDEILNKFITREDADYIIEIVASNGTSDAGVSEGHFFKVEIDKMGYDFILDSDSCTVFDKRFYCSYKGAVNLKEGAHIMSVASLQNNLKIDKFRLYRELETEKTYEMEVVRYGNTREDSASKGEQINLNVDFKPNKLKYGKYFLIGSVLPLIFSLYLVLKKRYAKK